MQHSISNAPPQSHPSITPEYYPAAATRPSIKPFPFPPGMPPTYRPINPPTGPVPLRSPQQVHPPKRPNLRAAATTPSNRNPRTKSQQIEEEAKALEKSFPAQLVLPQDHLTQDPDTTPQSLHAWLEDKKRNIITSERGLVYIASVPEIKGCVSPDIDPNAAQLEVPDINDIADYLSSIHLGLPIKQIGFCVYRDSAARSCRHSKDKRILYIACHIKLLTSKPMANARRQNKEGGRRTR